MTRGATSMTGEPRTAAEPSNSLAAPALAGWFAYLSADFLTHAVILAPWWRATESYWLEPTQLFARIPFAYGAFAIYVTAILWLVTRLFGRRPAAGKAAVFGAVAGALFGAASGLANYSILPTPVSALLVWPASAAFASVVAVSAGVSTLNSARPWSRAALVLLGAVLVFIVGVVLQNLLFPQGGSAPR